MLLIGEKYRSRLEPGLIKYRSDILWLPENPCVDERLSGHADLMLYYGSGKLVIADGINDCLVNILTSGNQNLQIFKSQNRQTETYPYDCGLCVRSTGSFDIYNPVTADPAVIARLNGRAILVNQGYAACAVCTVNKNSIITSDAGIAAKTHSVMNVLQIQPGFIKLPGFDYGFIGGAAFLIDECTLAFTGSIEHHPDKQRILDFLKGNNIHPVFLTDDPVFDIGGVIELP